MGDYSPNQEWEKQLSGFVLPFLTAAFAQFFGGTFAEGVKQDLFEWLKTPAGGNFEFTPDKDCGFPIDELADAFIKKHNCNMTVSCWDTLQGTTLRTMQHCLSG